MVQTTRILTGLVAALVATGAWAIHPLDPILHRQEADNANLPVGTIIPSGTVVFLTATAPASTNGTANYELELEIREISQPFQGVKTHSGGVITGNKPAVDVEWSGLTFTPLDGTWKWQARMNVNGTSTSNWVPFNGGQAAFTVAPPNVPDILVESVTLSNVVSDQVNDSLQFVVDGVFKNRGAVPTGNFVWKAYLSTNQTLESGDQLLFTATTPVDVPAQSTAAASSTLITLSPRPPPGAYYVLIEADPAPAGCSSSCGDVAEFDEKNNVGSMQNYFVNGIDLVATSITNGPATAAPGQTINLTVSFYNQGVDQAAQPVEFRVVATPDQNIGSNDFEIYRSSVTVGGAQVFNIPLTITLPAGVQGGDVYFGLQVDPPKGQVANPTPEALENNNTVITTATTKINQADFQPDFADLVDVLTGISTRKADMGFPARFKATVTNIGNHPSFPTHVGVILSVNKDPSLLSDMRIGDAPVPAIAPGATTTVDFTLTLPTTDADGNPLKPGDYYLFVQFDSFDTIAEVNESNIIPVEGRVLVRAPAADYTTTRVVAPARASAGERIPLSRTLKNIGTDDGAPTEYACFASVNNIIAETDYRLSFVDPDGSLMESKPLQLAANQTDERTEIVQLPGSLPAGMYYLGCIVDPEKKIVELEEQNNASATAFPVEVAAQSFQIVTRQLPDATVNVPFSWTLMTQNARGPVTWSTQSQLPEGLSLDPVTGTISGTPSATGTTSFKVHAHDGSFSTEAVLVSRVLPPTGSLVLTTDNLPAIVNSPSVQYQAMLSASGGARPYTWSIASGALPSGLSLDPDTGVIAGAPRAGLPNSQTTVTFRVQDALGGRAEKKVQVRLMPPGTLSIKTLAVADGLAGQTYFQDMAAEIVGGGSLAAPLTWSVVAGRLPQGLKLTTHADTVTGILDGRPLLAGTYMFTVQVVDSDGRSDAVDFVMTVHPSALSVTLAAPMPAHFFAGDTVDVQVISSSANPTTFRLFSGGLPEGITLNEEGRLQGTIPDDPAVAGRYSFVVEAKDTAGGKGLGAFSMEVRPRPAAAGCSSTGGLAPFAVAAGLILLAGLLAGRRRRVAVPARIQEK